MAVGARVRTADQPSPYVTVVQDALQLLRVASPPAVHAAGAAALHLAQALAVGAVNATAPTDCPQRDCPHFRLDSIKFEHRIFIRHSSVEYSRIRDFFENSIH
jgi:hypothetical protein